VLLLPPSRCKNVEAYLDGQSSKTSTYTDKMWQSGVDGPWKLTAFDSLGNATFQPNSHYNGPQKAQVKFVKEVAYTLNDCGENDLQAGKIDLGFVDPTILTHRRQVLVRRVPTGVNSRVATTIITGSEWDFNYAPFNFSSADRSLLQSRSSTSARRLQTAVDQTGIITNVDKGYGFPIYSPLPPNTPSTISGAVPNPYPFSLSAAKALLTSHGWTEEGGVMTCTSPGTGATDCGANIASGYTLNFKIIWASGSPALDDTFNAEVADWAQIGITFQTSEDTFKQRDLGLQRWRWLRSLLMGRRLDLRSRLLPIGRDTVHAHG